MHNDLSEIRNRIDEIDSEIIKLYRERLSLSEEVLEAKIRDNLPIYDEKREGEKISKIRETSVDKYEEEGLVRLFSLLMDESKKLQNRLLNGKKGL